MSKQSLLVLAVLALFALMYFCVTTHAPMLVAQVGTSPHAVPTPASLNLSITDGKITLNGVLPDETARASVAADAGKIFAPANVADRTSIGNVVASAAWLNALPNSFSAFRSIANGRLSINADNVVINTQVATQSDKSALIQQIAASVGRNMRINDQIGVDADSVANLQSRLDDLLSGRVIEFGIADDSLTSAGKAILDEVLPIVRQSVKGEIEIAGHTDSRGTPERNQQLSKKRAEAVRDYLIANGMEGDRLKAVGYGASRPIDDNATTQGQKKNRRIEFTVKP